MPLYGKLGDVYGRKHLFLVAIVVFLAGSALCGAASGMTQLVAFRAVQGIGADVGMLLLWRMNVHTTNGQAARNMVVAGIGMGSMMQVVVLSVQNAVRRETIGAATALTQFARQMGATIGVAIMVAIVNHGLPAAARGGGEGIGIHRLPPGLRSALASALHPAFFAAAIVAALVWVIAVAGVKEVALRRSLDEPATLEAAAGTPPSGVHARAE